MTLWNMSNQRSVGSVRTQFQTVTEKLVDLGQGTSSLWKDGTQHQQELLSSTKGTRTEEARSLTIPTLSTPVQSIKGDNIENRLEKDLWNDSAEGTERWSGYAMDFHKASETIRYKWGATKVRKIDMDGKRIRVIISTQYEAY